MVVSYHLINAVLDYKNIRIIRTFSLLYIMYIRRSYGVNQSRKLDTSMPRCHCMMAQGLQDRVFSSRLQLAGQTYN